MATTYTNSRTYTYTRIGVINNHFELFLKCAEISKSNIKKLLKAADNNELSAVGIYIEDDGHRIAEVEFQVDWDEHHKMVGTYGAYFDTDIPGWENGTAPEAYMAAQHLVLAARKLKKPVRSWIIVSPAVHSSPDWHKKICSQLGYSYGSRVPDWKNPPITQTRPISFLPEAKVITRVAR